MSDKLFSEHDANYTSKFIHLDFWKNRFKSIKWVYIPEDNRNYINGINFESQV